MGMPKGYLTNINLRQGKIGPERRKEILDGIADKGTFLPKGVLEEDLDEAFIDFIGKDLSITIEGEKVPVIFLTLQRWAEFTKTWKFTDENKNIEMPFISIVRVPAIQKGMNQAGLWNIPGNRTYTYYKVPTWDGNRKGMDLYKVPQPTSVAISYEVRLFTNKMSDLNKLNRVVHRMFQSQQCYINVNGHPMPVLWESVGDEGNIDDFENRRFYVQLYEMKLEGYILDEDDYEVIPTINRSLLFLETEEENPLSQVIFNPQLNASEVTYSFIFKPNSTEFSFLCQYDLIFQQLTGLENISRVVIKADGIAIFDGMVLNTPIQFNANSTITVKVYKSPNTTGTFQLIGNIF